MPRQRREGPAFGCQANGHASNSIHDAPAPGSGRMPRSPAIRSGSRSVPASGSGWRCRGNVRFRHGGSGRGDRPSRCRPSSEVGVVGSGHGRPARSDAAFRSCAAGTCSPSTDSCTAAGGRRSPSAGRGCTISPPTAFRRWDNSTCSATTATRAVTRTTRSGPTATSGRSGSPTAGRRDPERLAPWAESRTRVADAQRSTTRRPTDARASAVDGTRRVGRRVPVCRTRGPRACRSTSSEARSHHRRSRRATPDERPRTRTDLRDERDQEVLAAPRPGPRVDLRNPADVKAMLRRVAVDVPDTRAWRLEQHRATHPVVPALLTWRKAERIATTYGYRWLDEHVSDGRLIGDVEQQRRCRRAHDRIRRAPQPARRDAARRRRRTRASCSSAPISARSNLACSPRSRAIRR